MRILAIARKDLAQALHSLVGVALMFATPLLITGLLYLALGSVFRPGTPDLAPVRVVVAGNEAGAAILAFLQGPALAEAVQSVGMSGAEEARAAVDAGEADVAVIVAGGEAEGPVTATLYHDAAATVAPAIVQSIVAGYLEEQTAAQVALAVAASQLGTESQAAATELTQRYHTWSAEAERRRRPCGRI
jgi:hypothetical protein